MKSVTVVPFSLPDEVKVTRDEFRCVWKYSPNVFGEPSPWVVTLRREAKGVGVYCEGKGGSEHITQIEVAHVLALKRGWLKPDELPTSSPFFERAKKFVEKSVLALKKIKGWEE